MTDEKDRRQGPDGSAAPADDQGREDMPIKEKAAAAVEDPGEGRGDDVPGGARYDPETDPRNRAFKIEKFKEALKNTPPEQLGSRIDALADILTVIGHAIDFSLTIATPGNEISQKIKSIESDIKTAVHTMHQTTESIAQKIETTKDLLAEQRFTKLYDSTNQALDNVVSSIVTELTARASLLLEAMTNAQELEAFIYAELKKPEYDGMDLDQIFFTSRDENGKIIEGSLFDKLVIAAKAARDAEKAQTGPKATVKRAKKVEYPLDKPNAFIWNLLEADTEGGQIAFNLAKTGSNKQGIEAYYSINFDDLGDDIQITKRLTPFDKRVYIAVAALFNAGNNVITLRQIHYAMGNTGEPSAHQLQKINDSITKMTGARIFLDNQKETEAYKKYMHFKYDGSLLPIERGAVTVNGRLADAAIHIFREPPLITFAKQRKQITTIDIKLLQTPLNKTETNLQIEDYLITRISKAQNGKAKSCRVLFSTLYKHAEITEKKQKQRAPDKIKTYLDYYKKQSYISDYAIDADGVTVHWR